MELNLKHEDLLIQLRAKLNEDRIKLWEAPYYSCDYEITPNLRILAERYFESLSVSFDATLQALRELQVHSIERSKANSQFKESGLATIRVKATIPNEKAVQFCVRKKLDVIGSELIGAVANEISVSESRIKLIFNGKVIKSDLFLEEQGVKNGSQVLALVMAECPEDIKREDNMYLEMSKTRDDAVLLSECVDDLDEDDEYMKLEDQSGKAVVLPPKERRSLLVGLALHGRGRTAMADGNYSLALVLLLEADRHFNECNAAVLQSVDNWALLQLDVSWCYLCLQNLASANDVAIRLIRAEESFRKSYGDNMERLIALKGTAANERVLLMRLYLLQGIVAYHQNKRSEAKLLLDKAESELNHLKVDETGVMALIELGWSGSQARAGLRAANGDINQAHLYLEFTKKQRDDERNKHKLARQQKALGLCLDGSPVSVQFIEMLVGIGYSRKVAAAALKNSNNHVSEAVRIIQEQPELLDDSDDSSEDTESPSSNTSLLEPDERLVADLTVMGYSAENAKEALRQTNNNVNSAADLLLASGGEILAGNPDKNNESGATTSAGNTAANIQRKLRNKRRKERNAALERLSSSIKPEEDDHFDTSLAQEEQYLVQYKTLL